MSGSSAKQTKIPEDVPVLRESEGYPLAGHSGLPDRLTLWKFDARTSSLSVESEQPSTVKHGRDLDDVMSQAGAHSRWSLATETDL